MSDGAGGWSTIESDEVEPSLDAFQELCFHFSSHSWFPVLSAFQLTAYQLGEVGRFYISD